MAFRNVIRCFICESVNQPRVMRALVGENVLQLRQISQRFRSNLARPNAIFADDSRVCMACHVLIMNEVENENNPNFTRLHIIRAPAAGLCLVCRQGNRALRRLSLQCRTDIFISTGIYVTDNVRCCQNHFDANEHFPRNLYQNLQYFDRHYLLAGRELQAFLEILRQKATQNNQPNFADENSFSEEDFQIISPITKDQFNEMITYCDPVDQPGGQKQRKISRRDLLTFLLKLRQGLSDELLKLIFRYSTRQAVSLAIQNVRRSLMLRFVPENIGLNAIGREDYIRNHVTEGFANQLYNPDVDNPKPIAYIDATYAYIEKSSNFKALRFSYCLHKGRHLVKPVLVVAPDGYILDIHGPYFSDYYNNDASLLQHQFEHDADELREWLGEGAIVIVDRGYRDVIPLLDRLGINHRMPSLLERGQSQFSTEEANDSRLITKTRWIVEARNGHMRSIFKFLKNVIPFSHVKNLRDFYLIAGAIINRYREPILMEGATAELAQRILEIAQRPNEIQQLVVNEGLRHRGADQWNRLTAQDVLDFPVLDFNYLKDLTVGIYQLNLAPSYIQDKIIRDDSQEIQLDSHRFQPNLLRFRLYSRHMNRQTYQLWIRFRLQDQLEMNGDFGEIEPIMGYYCLCKCGARTLGCCAHVAAVIWFLGYARHQPNVKYPSNALLDSITDAGNRLHQP